MLRLWALLGLAFVMLAAPAGAVGAMPSGKPVSSTLADAALHEGGADDTDHTDHAGDAGGRATEPAGETHLHPQDHRMQLMAHAIGAVELEVDDDSRSDVAALPTAIAPAFEPVRVVRIFDVAAAEAGRSQVAGALARGPPVAR